MQEHFGLIARRTTSLSITLQILTRSSFCQSRVIEKSSITQASTLRTPPDFWRDFCASRALDEQGNIAAMIVMLTAVRVGDVVSMKWDDVDLERNVWKFTVGKTKRVYRTPLPTLIIDLLRMMKDKRLNSPFVFPKPRKCKRSFDNAKRHQQHQKGRWLHGICPRLARHVKDLGHHGWLSPRGH